MRHDCRAGITNSFCLLLALFCMPVFGLTQGPPQALDLDTANENDGDFFADDLSQQATIAATRALWSARINFGEESIEAALAQLKLGYAQQKSADHPAAIDSFQQSIRRIEAAEGIVSPRLVKPLMGLATSQNVIGAFDRGLVNYQRALRLNHVEHGLYNEQQLPIRDGLTETYLSLGDQSNAEFEQKIQPMILQQEYGPDPQRLLPAFFKLAGWYERTNQPQKQAYQYQTAVRMIRNEMADKDSPAQITALLELANVYLRMDMYVESLQLLKRSYRLNAEADQPDPRLAAHIQVKIGDFYTIFGQRNNAREHYMLAWKVLNELGNEETLIAEYFGNPIVLQGPALPDIYPTNASTAKLFVQQPEQFQEGYVMAEYDVDATGRVRNVRIIESAPSALIDKKLRISLSQQLFRPRVINGEMAATNGERLYHLFSYEQQTEQADDDKDNARLTRPDLRSYAP